MFYLDTSFAVTAYSAEPRTDACQIWLNDNVDSDLLISDWVNTEFSSAISLKVRTGEISVENRAAILSRWLTAAMQNYATAEITKSHFESAARMADNYDLSLRAGDALHIAIARNAGCTLVTLDKRMAEAALKLGVPVAAI